MEGFCPAEITTGILGMHHWYSLLHYSGTTVLYFFNRYSISESNTFPLTNLSLTTRVSWL